jgi:alginate O-acetyltransferase complex protein AlgI
MVFSSISFLFLFLPLVWLVYAVLPNLVLRNIFLLLASAVFYVWGEGNYILLIVASVAVNYLCGLWIGREVERSEGPSKLPMVVAVVFNLLLLAFFKYTGFAVRNLNGLLVLAGHSPLPVPSVHLPLGISFLTFHAISYCVDCYRKVSHEQKNPLNLALYFLVFPHLIAGPIVRYNHICEQLTERRQKLDRIVSGIERLIFGLGKKVLIANTLGQVVDKIFALHAGQLGCGVAWFGVFCYGLQIYFDFSGYSDMAIGLAKLFGFEFPENFNYPYIATSITDFWRRWHMTLSNWMRDYLYIPLGGNRKGSLRTYLNLVTVFFLCGLWHGASWNFVAWGMVQGVLMIAERVVARRAPNLRVPRVFAHAYVILAVMFAWVFFRSEDMPGALAYLRAMAGGSGPDAWKYPAYEYAPVTVKIALAFGIALSAPWLRTLSEKVAQAAKLSDWRARSAQTAGLLAYFGSLAVVFIVSCAELAVSTYNPFIYFRF